MSPINPVGNSNELTNVSVLEARHKVLNGKISTLEKQNQLLKLKDKLCRLVKFIFENDIPLFGYFLLNPLKIWNLKTFALYSLVYPPYYELIKAKIHNILLGVELANSKTIGQNQDQVLQYMTEERDLLKQLIHLEETNATNGN